MTLKDFIEHFAPH